MVDQDMLLSIAKKIPGDKLEALLQDPSSIAVVVDESTDEGEVRELILSIMKLEWDSRQFDKSRQLTLTLPLDQWGAICIAIHIIICHLEGRGMVKAVQAMTDGASVQNIDTIEGIKKVHRLLSKWGRANLEEKREEASDD